MGPPCSMAYCAPSAAVILEQGHVYRPLADAETCLVLSAAQPSQHSCAHFRVRFREAKGMAMLFGPPLRSSVDSSYTGDSLPLVLRVFSGWRSVLAGMHR